MDFRPVDAGATSPIGERGPNPLGKRDSVCENDDPTDIAKANTGALLARAMRLTGRHADAWDLVQETFVRALTRRPRDVVGERLRRWLLVILGNLYRDHRRAEGRRPRVVLSDLTMNSLPADEAPQEPPWLDVEISDVRACLDRLNPRIREAYVLHEEEGLPLATIAARLGVPLATAGTRVYRARRTLRKLLTPETSAP
jgi:RNA polymerase sigma-70 factor (ECF subfamily)